MNAITTALVTAGIKIPPLNKRIWLWLNDHPGKTSEEVGLAINSPCTHVSSTLSNMEKRKMVTSTRSVTYKSKKGAQLVKHYKTAGFVFEVKPVPYQPKKKKVRPALAPVALAPVAPVIAPTPLFAAATLKKSLMESLDDYKLGELRAVYAQLSRMFATTLTS